MLARIVFGAVLASSVAAPVFAETMNADEARKFVANKLFAFNCFDGTKGVGKITDDGAAAGAVQFSGAPQARNMRLPSNTLQVRGQQICASIKGIPFEPCFNLNKTDNVSFRGSVSGLGFAYCDFRRHGNARVFLARSISRPRSLRAPGVTQSADASARAEVRPASHSEPASLELRRSASE
jgi:hypothetical protein